MKAFRFAWRFFRRDLISGELTVLLVSLVVAVAAITTVGFVTDRTGRALHQEANQLLGADAVLRADQPLSAEPLELAQSLKLQTTQTQTFTSMIRKGEQFQLTEIKAVGENFPLRGRLKKLVGDSEQEIDQGAPQRGTVWASGNMAKQMSVQAGDVLRVGDAELKVAMVLGQEPDAAMDYFSISPRLIVNIEDLPKTGLVQVGSRVTYRLMVAGETSAVEKFSSAMGKDLGRGQRLELLSNSRPEMREALERADKFLGLAALIAVILAGVALAMATRRHVQHHMDSCAMLRCFGASQKFIMAVFLLELAIAGIFATFIGAVIGVIAQALLLNMLGQIMAVSLPAPGVMPVLQGLSIALILLAAFSLPAVLRLRSLPTLRVLRRDLGLPPMSAWVSIISGLAAVAWMLWWKAGDATVATIMLGGLTATIALLAGIGWLMLRGALLLRKRSRGTWRLGLASMSRRSGAGVLQIVAMGLGLMALSLLWLVRSDLLARWQDAIPANTPNQFMINLQSDQVDAMREFLTVQGVEAQLSPMVRARLGKLNGKPIKAIFDNDESAQGQSQTQPQEQNQREGQNQNRGQRRGDRLYNLSFSDAQRADNEIVAGKQWAAGDDNPQFSIEQNFAQSRGWKVGDVLEFDVAGTPISGTIASIRKVDWESFRPNFFVIGTEKMLAQYPASYISSFRAPEDSIVFNRELINRFPNVTVIDVRAIMAQVQRTADQVSRAVEFVFIFTLLAGLVVLAAAIAASQDERLREGAVMRALGASRKQMLWTQLIEFSAIGILAGVTGAAAANGLSAAFAKQVFDLPVQFNGMALLAATVIGAVLVTALGLLATRRVLSIPPALMLRRLLD